VKRGSETISDSLYVTTDLVLASYVVCEVLCYFFLKKNTLPYVEKESKIILCRVLEK
jgi:hypothetical protein